MSFPIDSTVVFPSHSVICKTPLLVCFRWICSQWQLISEGGMMGKSFLLKIFEPWLPLSVLGGSVTESVIWAAQNQSAFSLQLCMGHRALSSCSKRQGVLQPQPSVFLWAAAGGTVVTLKNPPASWSYSFTVGCNVTLKTKTLLYLGKPNLRHLLTSTSC